MFDSRGTRGRPFPGRFAAATLAVILAAAACSSADSSPSPKLAPSAPAAPTPSATAPAAPATLGTFELTSSAYVDGGTIPDKYTCYGDNVSPPLAWKGAPPETAAFVLIMEDYTAGYTHWVVVNLPGGASGSLAENAGRDPKAVTQIVPFVAPCPPSGYQGTYHISLYALSARLDAVGLADQSTVEDAIRGKVIAQATLTATAARD